MFGNELITWENISIFLAVIVFSAIRWRFERRMIKQTPITDDEYLTRMASIGECSVYEMFFVCAEKWNIPREQIEEDFKEYLLDSRIPHYVRDFARQHKKDLDRHTPPVFRFV